MNIIDVYIPEKEIIPTALRLKVHDVIVDYWPVKGAFAYDFRFFETGEEKALKYAEEIAEIMCDQSEDHFMRWKVVDISLVKQEKKYYVGPIVRIEFKIKDLY